MIAKTAQRLQAIELRKKGLSYSEILETIHVSHASLSLWLHGMKLSENQTLRLKNKGDLARKLGSAVLREDRILRTRNIIEKAESEIERLSKKDLMLIGTTLYWAEGNKQKEHNPSASVIFSNSDPTMVRLYLSWLEKCLLVSHERIVFEIYIHKSHMKSVSELTSYWSKVTGFPVSKFDRVYYKKNKIHSIRKNRGSDYSGVLRIWVRKSTDLNRKIQGWVRGICLRGGVAS